MTPVHESEDDRYGIYTLRPSRPGVPADRVCLAETSRAGIGPAILTLAEEGEFTAPADRGEAAGSALPFGLFDRLERQWIINPWARQP